MPVGTSPETLMGRKVDWIFVCLHILPTSQSLKGFVSKTLYVLSSTRWVY